MSKNSIISIILHNNNVNLYTKILIFLFYKNKSKSYNISDNEICKRLNLSLHKDRKKIYKILCKLEEDKIIKVNILHRKRFFKWLIYEEEEKANNSEELLHLLENYNWLY